MGRREATENWVSARRRHGRGWQAKNTRGWKPPDLPAWAELLEELGVAEHEAERVAGERGEIGERLRGFVRARCLQRYVPTVVLRALGLEQAVEESVSIFAHGGMAPRIASQGAQGPRLGAA